MGRLFDRLLEAKTDLQLVKKVEVKDVKAYLQHEYELARQREEYIETLEQQITEYKELQVKYDALLVVQENTTKRLEARDKKIKELKEQLKKEREKKLALMAKITEIRTNAKRLVAEAKKTKKGSK